MPTLPLLNDDQPELFMEELMKEADPDKIASAVSQQVELLGSQSLYERINSNFKERRFEAFLAKVGKTWLRLWCVELDFFLYQEHFNLYRWREEYFHAQFPYLTWFTRGFDVVPYQDFVPYKVSVSQAQIYIFIISCRVSVSCLYGQRWE